ncbi:hypothetical protein ACJEIK_17660 [Mycobacterium sp. SMC-16]|uniref:hypothetical protein n=1 Tax=unclassified Mycobacterium TaxID=2642494 RepID=UPI0038763E46
MTPRPAGYRWPLLTAIVAVVMLCAAVGFTLTHERVTVRPIAAAAAMPREQGEAVAQSTVRLWAHQVGDRQGANVRALTCAASGRDTDAGKRLAQVGAPGSPIEILGFGDFTEDTASGWSMLVFFFRPGASDNGKVFHFAVEDEELRLCDITDPPSLG